MRNRMIKAAAAVPSMKVADTAYNTEQIIQTLKDNSDCGLIVFPELCITGYTCGDLFSQETLLAGGDEGLLRIAEETRNIKGLTAGVGLPVRHRNTD